MAIVFPTSIIPKGMGEPRLLRGRWSNQSPYSQSTQEKITANFLYEIDFEFPPLTNAQMDLVRLARDQGGEVVMPIYRPFEALETAGSPIIAAGSSLNAINISGINSGFALNAGRVVSILDGGRYYLYSLLNDSAAGSTTRTIHLTQSMRKTHAAGCVLNCAPAYIQGFAEWELPSNSVNTSGFYDGLKVTIREVK